MAKSKLSKESIIETCKELVKKENLRSVTIQRIATIYNVSPGTVYRLFPSKSHLLLATVQEIWKSCFENINYSKIDSFVDCMQIVYDAIRSVYDEYPLFFEMHMRVFPDDCPFDTNKYKDEIIESCIQGMVEVLMHDKRVSEHCFNEIYDQETFVWLVYNKMIIRLMEGRKTCNKLKRGIGEMLYGQGE